MALHTRIDELRRIQGLSRRALADAVGVNEAQVSRWIAGKTAPGVGSIVKLARALGVSVDVLLHDTPDPPPGDPHSAAVASIKRIARTLGVEVGELREDPSEAILVAADDPQRCMTVRAGAQCILRRHGVDLEHDFRAYDALGQAV